jgi:putative PIN family toxin of toxin-antitoxin system
MQSFRIIIDANVWVRYARFRNLNPLLDRFDKHSLVPVINRYLLSEVFDALIKKSWMNNSTALATIQVIENVCISSPALAVYRLSPDPKDNYLIDLAVQNNCAFIISDDTELLSLPLLPVQVKSCNWFLKHFPV